MIGADFLAPGRLWWLLAVAALAAGYVATQLWGRRATVRFTQVDLLDRVAPSRPGWRRHVVAALMLLGLTAGVVAIARPVSATTERTESEGRIMLLFDVSLSMMATDVAPTRLDAAKEAAREFVDQVDDDVEVGLISFSGNVAVEVEPTLDRDRLDQGIEDLELAESTAIGDALSTGTDLLVRLAGDQDAADEDIAPGALVLLTDGETTVGRDTQDGAQEAADAGVPVFTIAFGTADGSITDPVSGQQLPVPVQPAPLEQVAETTGGAAYEAATATELSDAYERIQDSLGETLGEEIEMVTELTWKWAAAALALIAIAWALAMWWLRGMI
ncbi:MAG TPA: VWA domain-containing protein [Ilumatobacteraceae bacterium]|nr:VWA domain-containing protein [Ilumatobacteraceae bacterium]